MIYMKHAEHGNKYFPDERQAELETQGWVRWPRTAAQKAADRAPAAAPAAEPTKEELQERCAALGIKTDARWGMKRLQEALDDHRQ